MRLPRDMRIRRRSEFQRVRQKGKSYGGRFLVIGSLHEEELSVQFKVGFILTKKVGKAHERNLVRRRLRGILRDCGERVRKDHLIVTIARYNAASASYAELENDWQKLATRAGLLEENVA